MTSTINKNYVSMLTKIRICVGDPQSEISCLITVNMYLLLMVNILINSNLSAIQEKDVRLRKYTTQNNVAVGGFTI